MSAGEAGRQAGGREGRGEGRGEGGGVGCSFLSCSECTHWVRLAGWQTRSDENPCLLCRTRSDENPCLLCRTCMCSSSSPLRDMSQCRTWRPAEAVIWSTT